MTGSLLALILAGCARQSPPPPPAYAPTNVAWQDMVGTPPEQPAPLPAFRVLNQTGEVRTEADLRGSMTAIWFYPMANSPG